MNEHQQLLPLLRDEEAELQFDEFTNDTALALGLAIVAIAKAERLAITIDIARHGQQLFHCAMPGTSADNDAWVERKKRVVARFSKSSWHVGTICRAQGVTFEDKYRLDRDLFAASGGGFPVTVRRVGVVGTIAVSGLPQAEDHALIVRVLRGFLASAGQAA